MTVIKRLILALFTLAPAQFALAETLVLGSVEHDVRRQILNFQPLADYLRISLASEGVTDVQIKVMREEHDIALAMKNGDIDLYFDSPVVAAKVARESGGTPLLRQFRKGDATYRSVIVVPVDGPVQSLNDLVGRRIAFDERASSSGFLLPAYMLDDAGLKLSRLRTRTSNVPVGEVGYLFTRDNTNTMYWLVRGWTDAGAMNNRNFQHLDQMFPGQFKALAESPLMPREVVVQRPNMDQTLSGAIVKTLTSMHHSSEGRTAIQSFFETDRFVAFPNSHTTFLPIFAILDRLTRIGII
ncbi:MAG: phosphate/phosphite/phosphonate ABC transporter substrate-binding protein [Shimia sp.]|nr:phosphate/phosphite/phosphonate ABC transporter substrate-binding protein [Shimia sp.]